jgi:hypothetical protein
VIGLIIVVGILFGGIDYGTPLGHEDRCELAVIPEVTLGDTDGPGAVGPTIHVRRDSRSRYYTTGGQFLGVIQVFDGNGTFSHALGGFGGGPGEFRGIADLRVSPGDSLFVWDNRNLRMTVLSPAGEVARSTRMAVRILPGGGVPLPDADMLVNANVPTRERAGLPIHRLDAEGRILTSFGADEPYFDARNPVALLRAMTLAGPDTLWTAVTTDYKLESWVLSAGRKTREIVRDPDWWVRGDAAAVLSPDHPPASRIQGIRALPGTDLVLVIARRPGPNWRDGLELRRTPEGEFWIPVVWEDVHNSVIEVLDASRDRLLASLHLPHYVRGFVDDTRIFSYRETADGFPFLDVWRVILTGCPLSPSKEETP